MTATTEALASPGEAVATPARTLPLTRWAALGALAAALIAVGPMLGRLGLLADWQARLIGTGGCLVIAALSLNILVGYTGQLSLSQYAFFGLGTFVSARLTVADPTGLPFTIGVLAAIVAAGAFAFLVGLPALRLRGLYLAIVTVAVSYVAVESLFVSEFLTHGSGSRSIPRPWIGSFRFPHTYDYLSIVLVAVVVVWLVDRNLTGSKLGRAFQAIRADETMAASFGVNVARYKLLAFTLSGGLAGLAGSLWGHLIQAAGAQDFPLEQSLLLVVIVVLGGLGSRVGVAVSATFYTLFPFVLNEIFGNDANGWIIVASSALLMYTVSQHPTGLAGAWREAQERKHRRSVHGDDAGDEQPAMPKLPDLPRPTGLPPRAVEQAGTAMLAARGITVDFGGLRAVDGASLEVHRGRIVGLIGPNGAGKTTLFNAISGALRPTAGQVEFLGRDLTAAPAHARAAAGIGRTFQLIGLAKDLSVTENLLLAQHQVAGYGVASALVGLGRAPRVEQELRARAHDALVALGFERYADTPVRNLSHGQQRIVEIGCALVTAPELVMLDEPSAGMAPGAVENLALRLRDMRDELGRTVLLIEHNIPLVLDVCDELYVMANGSILAHGDPDEVVSRPDVIAAYLGEAVA